MADRYQILGKMARGGIGAIYRARDTIMGRDVAIKRLLPLEQTHLNEAADGSLQREAAALARFQHPNVVTIYAFEEDEEGPYVVMELVEGENLKETIERGALPVEDFEELTLQVLDPLVAARDLNLLHRDIKPSNIMLTWLATGKFQLKVLDFGLAKFSQLPSTQTLDQTGSFLGSIDFLAPEQLELRPLDQRTDLYSLGCVLYYCLTQSPPFEGDNAAKTMSNHMKHRVTPIHEIRPDIPVPLADWVMRMIARFPDQRPADARAALIEFQAARKGISPRIAEREDLPVAEVAPTPPPSTPGKSVPGADPPSTPVTPGAPPRKATRIHTRPQLITRPQRGAKRPLTTPTRLQTGARKAPPAADRKSERKSKAKYPLAPLGITALLLLLLAALALAIKRNGERTPPPEVNQAPANTAKAPAESPPPAAAPPKAPAAATVSWPEFRNAEDPIRKTPPPAVTGGLIAHYSAADQVMGPDLKKPAQPGKRATVWGNLAKLAAPDHFLQTPSREEDTGLWLVTVDQKKFPELKSSIPALKFGTQTLMVSHGNQIRGQFGEAGFTQIAVMQIINGNGRFLQYLLPDHRSALEFNAVQGGYESAMNRGSIQQSTTTNIGDHRSEWVVFSMTWDPKQEIQRHYFRLGNGFQYPGPAGDAPYKPLDAISYRIGSIPGQPGAEVPPPGGHVAELLVFNRLLPEKERKQVEDDLFRRYFNPKYNHKLEVPIPHEDGTVPKPKNPKDYTPTTPPPPVTGGLVGHYSAAELTYGYDLETPAKPGENVLAWGNIAKGAAEEHLMEYKSGQASATPILQMAAPKDHSTLNGPHPVLYFPWNATLKAIGQPEKESLEKNGVTGFLVVKPVGNDNTIFFLEAGEKFRLLTISRTGDNFKCAMQITPGKWNSTAQNISASRFTILSFIWDHEKGEQTLFARQSDGQTVASPAKPGTVGAKGIDRYWLGLFQSPWEKNKEPSFSGRVAELLLYARPLSLDERKAVEDSLHKRYFAK